MALNVVLIALLVLRPTTPTDSTTAAEPSPVAPKTADTVDDGGESPSKAPADQNVYKRVDIYNPATNTWRLGTPMPTAKHGHFPLLVGNRIVIAGGGVTAGHSQSTVVEIYNPR